MAEAGMKTKMIKRTIDAVMLLLFIYLVNYNVFGALMLHAWAGIALFALLVLHNVWNAQYWRTVFKGKYNARRSVLLAVNTLLLIDTLLMIASAAMMSRAVFDASPFPMSREGHILHKVSTTWGYFLVMVHLSLHTSVPLKRWEKTLTGWRKTVYMVCCVLVVLAGAVVLYKSGMLRMMAGMRGRIRFANVWQVAAGNAAMIAGLTAAMRAV